MTRSLFSGKLPALAALAAILTVPAFAWAQRGGRGGTEAPVTPVPFERIVNATDEPQNWFTYNGQNSSQRHSGLTQIAPENAEDLVLKWVFQSQSTEKHEVTPLVVDGVMYTIESPNGVVALNAETGAILWRYNHTPHEAARNCCGRLSRGLAILDDKIFLAAFDARMIALDARTGQELWNTAAGDPTQAEAFTHAPLVVGDKVLAGTAGGEFGVRGWIAAFDVDTGEEVWRFYTVPGPGEPGNETWGGDSWEHGGAPIWVTGSYDPELNLTYWGTGNPGPDWDGSVRPGDNLYSCSVIALNADTGELVWHYQFFPHNEFDWDATQTPVLVDMEFEGQMRKTMLFANRSGVYYVLDRETGEFLLGRSFVRTNWIDGFDPDGRPRQVIFPTPEGTQVFPGNQGGTNWYPPSYSPATGLVYIPAWENTASIYRTAEEPTEFHEGQTFAGPFPGRSNTGEEYSAVRALDPATGEKVWDYVQTAPSTEAGILTTASNLLFSGSRDGHFYALDARDGTVLWDIGNLGASVSAGPMSYAVNGEQFVAIQVGRALYAFGLRE